MKKAFVLSMALLAGAAAPHARADGVNFMVGQHNISYHANGDVKMVLYSKDWLQTALIVFRRGELPKDRTLHDATTGVVTLFYPIDELPVVRSLLLESTIVAFSYLNDGTTDAGYLYVSP